MSYLKIQNNKIIEAPYSIIRNGKTILGYNNNINMLLEDGFTYFEKPISNYIIENNQIIEKQLNIQPNNENAIFSKLQIRRTMRKLGLEEDLNNFLASNINYLNDWNDAQVIDLNDPSIQELINNNIITQEYIDNIKNNI